jgi:hypothetical protein
MKQELAPRQQPTTLYRQVPSKPIVCGSWIILLWDHFFSYKKLP